MMKGLCLLDCDDVIFASHYDDMIFSPRCDEGNMFITLQQQHIDDNGDIAMMGLCSSHFNDMTFK
jgi:hypothetical protein